jgi:hypothetical protein
MVLCLSTARVLAGGDCCEKMAKAGEGWCDTCKHGQFYGISVAARKLYDALAGVSAKDSGMDKCPGCAKAMKDGGTCEHCHVSFVNGKMYTSSYAYALAVGKPATDDKIAAMVEHCETCNKASKSADGGYCSECKGGFVSGRYYQGKTAYDAAVNAHKVVSKAASASEKCPDCGAAIVKDGKCEHCNVAYKNGEATKG